MNLTVQLKRERILSRSETPCLKKKKEIRARTVAGFFDHDAKQGFKIFRVNIESPATHVIMSDWILDNFMIPKPARDDNAKLVAPFGTITKSKDHEDALLLQRIEPNSTMGPIMSVRAFDFDSCGSSLVWARSSSAG